MTLKDYVIILSGTTGAIVNIQQIVTGTAGDLWL